MSRLQESGHSRTHLPNLYQIYRESVSSERWLPDFVLAIAPLGWTPMAPNEVENERDSDLPEREGGSISMIIGAIVD